MHGKATYSLTKLGTGLRYTVAWSRTFNFGMVQTLMTDVVVTKRHCVGVTKNALRIYVSDSMTDSVTPFNVSQMNRAFQGWGMGLTGLAVAFVVSRHSGGG